MKSSISDITKGIDAVTESPMEKAISQKDKMLTNLTAAVNDGRWEKGLKSVTLSDWKANTKAKVSSSLSTGVDAAMPKRQKFDTWLVQTLNGVLPTVAAMPKMTMSDSLARVSAVMNHMHDNRYKTS
jgi:hypothetical protein